MFNTVDESTEVVLPNPVRECLKSVAPVSRLEGVVLIDRSGRRRDIRHTAAPVKSASGEVIGTVLVFQDISGARQQQRQLAHTATHDALTGLRNRYFFERELRAQCDDAREGAQVHALCFLDLDRFKMVNDAAGHRAGDALLREVAQVIRRSVRAHDITARFGGDEFGIILKNCSIDQAKAVCETVVASIQSLAFSWEGRTYDIGACAGVTLITATSSAPAVLLHEADTACYSAKGLGRSRVVVYQLDQIDVRRQGDTQIGLAVRTAIDENRLRLHAQEFRLARPDQAQSRFYELLLRIDDGTGQLLWPAAFLPILERYDLIRDIDRRVCAIVIESCGEWLRENPNVLFSINVSANSLTDAVRMALTPTRGVGRSMV